MTIEKLQHSGTKDEQGRSPVGRRAFLVATGGALIGLTWWHFDHMKPAHADPASQALPGARCSSHRSHQSAIFRVERMCCDEGHG